jgi:hypothetical protein
MEQLRILLIPGLCLLIPLSANAFEHSYRDWNFSLTGNGAAGWADARDDSGLAKDWFVRAALRYGFSQDYAGGIVYSIGAWDVDSKNSAKDAFAFVETPMGRAELGITDPVSVKLGLGLPDVGGLRVNRDSVIYEFANPEPMITRTSISGANYAARLNLVSAPSAPVQLGFSFAPKQRHFNSSSDFGIKYKSSAGKTKLALSLGASFIDAPDDMSGGMYAPRVNADWRAQVSAGLNLQYNSWNWGLVARAIYDKNPIGAISDGFSAGTGLSYDLLNWSVSVSYMMSEIGTFHDRESELAHLGILSLRYKINQYFNLWASGGMVSADETSPFISGGIGVKF